MYFIFLRPTVSLFFFGPSNLLTISTFILPSGWQNGFTLIHNISIILDNRQIFYYNIKHNFDNIKRNTSFLDTSAKIICDLREQI